MLSCFVILLCCSVLVSFLTRFFLSRYFLVGLVRFVSVRLTLVFLSLRLMERKVVRVRWGASRETSLTLAQQERPNAGSIVPLTPPSPLPSPYPPFPTLPPPSVIPSLGPRCTTFFEQELTLETENEIKFNGNYQALYRQLKDVYTKIGASDFFGVVGEKFDSRRHIKVSGVFPFPTLFSNPQMWVLDPTRWSMLTVLFRHLNLRRLWVRPNMLLDAQLCFV